MVAQRVGVSKEQRRVLAVPFAHKIVVEVVNKRLGDIENGCAHNHGPIVHNDSLALLVRRELIGENAKGVGPRLPRVVQRALRPLRKLDGDMVLHVLVRLAVNAVVGQLVQLLLKVARSCSAFGRIKVNVRFENGVLPKAQGSVDARYQKAVLEHLLQRPIVDLVLCLGRKIGDQLWELVSLDAQRLH